MISNLSVVIPSRQQANQIRFLERAVKSVCGQSVAANFNIDFLVGVDKGSRLNDGVCTKLGIRCIESGGNSQASALNAAIDVLNSDYVAFLEDDDQWLPQYLDYAAKAVLQADFVSSTQAEYDEHGQLLRVNDFPTPSGWFMPVATLRKVGGFNESYRFHLDNEWLGRLAQTGLRRLHLVESTAPVDVRYLQAIRPWLANVIKLSAGHCRLARHDSPYPLVRRLVHSSSGMAQIAANQSLTDRSRQEIQQLIDDFGRIPW
jgi:glycosyltransferase involved in cell wall biosynthesis